MIVCYSISMSQKDSTTVAHLAYPFVPLDGLSNLAEFFVIHPVNVSESCDFVVDFQTSHLSGGSTENFTDSGKGGFDIVRVLGIIPVHRLSIRGA